MSRAFDPDFLLVSKPARYVGGEPNSAAKKPGSAAFDFCLIFPDIYEIGCSHVGYRLLYDLINRSEKVYCQRFFAPWPDAVDVLGSKAFVSSEEGRPLKDFDALGFSLQYEMSYTTALAVLKRSGIPLRSSERAESDPVIMAGGSCVYNPAPLNRFIDAFYIGEGDEGLRKVLEGAADIRAKGGGRKDVLGYMNGFSFMYVPSVDPDKTVYRDIFANFPESDGCLSPFLPLMPAVQDRTAVEIARGCTAGCRFCQAGMIYRPVRERAVEKIAEDAERQIKSTGYAEASLLSLSTGDYSRLEELFASLDSRLGELRVALSVPSLRADSVSREFFHKISGGKKTGFTIAPEAGTERMRRVINKNLTEDVILKAVENAADAGYGGVKLYFMLGLPTETDEDVLGIARLVSLIKSAVKGRNFDVSASVSHFVPKPHTPFERLGQVEKEELERRMYLLKDEFKRRRIKFKFHDTRISTAEAALSRGDERTADVLERMAELGFYLDAWDDYFDYGAWSGAYESCGKDIKKCASAGYGDDEILPWGNIKTGVDDSFLKAELKRAYDEVSTPDCRKEACSGCGVCDFNKIAPRKALHGGVSSCLTSTGKNYAVYEMTYEKKDGARLLSALELSRFFSFRLRAAGADLKFSEGFSPMPRVVLYLPLPVGMEGENEKLLFESAELDTEKFLSRVNNFLPAGLRAKELVKADSLKTGADFVSVYGLGPNASEQIREAISLGEAFYMKKSKNGSMKRVDLADYLLSFEGEEIALRSGPSGGFNLLELLKKRGVDPRFAEVVRISVKTA